MTGCVALLGQVHEQDGYPLLWPTDPQAWLSAGKQLAAWVADQTGIISGHVALVRPREGAAASAWSETLRARVEDLLCVSLLSWLRRSVVGALAAAFWISPFGKHKRGAPMRYWRSSPSTGTPSRSTAR